MFAYGEASCAFGTQPNKLVGPPFVIYFAHWSAQQTLQIMSHCMMENNSCVKHSVTFSRGFYRFGC